MKNIKTLIEALKNIHSKETISYPIGEWPGKKYSNIPETLRGKPIINEEKCIGCEACHNACSAFTIKFFNEEDKRRYSIDINKCIFCERCEDVCPEDAIKLSNEFELTHFPEENEEKRYVKWEKILKNCKNCGEKFAAIDQINKIHERISLNINPKVSEEALKDYEIYSNYCPKCRKILSYKIGINPSKYYLRIGKDLKEMK
jgi:formate hydrogenlyase subunit 6/NADH:ubiquinone oxidoreductase subunit I